VKDIASHLKFAALVAATVASASAFSATTASVQSGPGTITYNFGTAGSQANPWTISENITSNAAPVVLQLTNPESGAVGPTNSTGSGHAIGKWFSKTVTNNTASAWSSFDLELQQVLGTPSTDGDGLSFAQGAGFSFTSDKFTTVHSIEDVRDFLNFDGGSVGVGESVTFHFAITDSSNDHHTFYLSETPNRVVGAIPEPETYALMLAGLGLMGFITRRRNRT